MRTFRQSLVLVPLGCVIGAWVGYVYGLHQRQLIIEAMRAHWGWVCGTGLDFGVWAWTVLLGLLGGLFLPALLDWCVRRRSAPE